MRKLASFLLLAVLMTAAYADLADDFETEAVAWMQTNQFVLDQYNRVTILLEYYQKNAGNASCLDQLQENVDSVYENGANEWNRNKSRLGDIVTEIMGVRLPPIIVKGKVCANPEVFLKDEAYYNTYIAESLENNEVFRNLSSDNTEELEYYTSGNITTNETCIQSVTDILELVRLSQIAQTQAVAAENITDLTVFAAQFATVYLPDAIKASQRCLVGDDRELFTQASLDWVDKSPENKAFNQQQQGFGFLYTVVLPHDSDCVDNVSKAYDETYNSIAAEYRSGSSRISDLSSKLLHVHLVHYISELRNCLLAVPISYQ